MLSDLPLLVQDEVITLEDLSGFSEDVQEDVRGLAPYTSGQQQK